MVKWVAVFQVVVILMSFAAEALGTGECPINRAPVVKPEYVYPLDDFSEECPFVRLKGKILKHVFPGVPNYESIADGDYPEERWVLVISDSEIERLRRAGSLPDEDLYGKESRGWVQLIPPRTERDPVPFANKQVVVEGFLGTLAFHVHTPVTIEAKDIYDDE